MQNNWQDLAASLPSQGYCASGLSVLSTAVYVCVLFVDKAYTPINYDVINSNSSF